MPVLRSNMSIEVVFPAVRFVTIHTDHSQSKVHSKSVSIAVFGKVKRQFTVFASMCTLAFRDVLPLMMVAL